jgi:hypothetical protein
MERSFVVEFRYAGNYSPKSQAKFDVAEEELTEQEFSYELIPIATRPGVLNTRSVSGVKLPMNS